MCATSYSCPVCKLHHIILLYVCCVLHHTPALYVSYITSYSCMCATSYSCSVCVLSATSYSCTVCVLHHNPVLLKFLSFVASKRVNNRWGLYRVNNRTLSNLCYSLDLTRRFLHIICLRIHYPSIQSSLNAIYLLRFIVY